MKTKIVAGCVLYSHGKIALIKETKAGIAGLWNLPCGGLEENEAIETGALRETIEETGIHPTIERLVGIYQNPNRNGVNVIKFIYAAHTEETTFQTPPDIAEARLFSREEIETLPLRDKAILMALDDYFNDKPVRIRHYD